MVNRPFTGALGPVSIERPQKPLSKGLGTACVHIRGVSSQRQSKSIMLGMRSERGSGLAFKPGQEEGWPSGPPSTVAIPVFSKSTQDTGWRDRIELFLSVGAGNFYLSCPHIHLKGSEGH